MVYLAKIIAFLGILKKKARFFYIKGSLVELNGSNLVFTIIRANVLIFCSILHMP